MINFDHTPAVLITDIEITPKGAAPQRFGETNPLKAREKLPHRGYAERAFLGGERVDQNFFFS